MAQTFYPTATTETGLTWAGLVANNDPNQGYRTLDTTKPGTGSALPAATIAVSASVFEVYAFTSGSIGQLTWDVTAASWTARAEVTTAGSTISINLNLRRVAASGTDYVNGSGSAALAVGTGIKSWTPSANLPFNTAGSGRPSPASTDRVGLRVEANNSSSMTAGSLAVSVGGTFGSDLVTPLTITGGGSTSPIPARVTVSNSAVPRAARW